MFVHSASRFAKKLLPDIVFDPLRRLGTLALTPFLFSYYTGHFRSSIRRAAVDRYGEPIPWYTYPMVQILQSKDFSDKSILEFGAGQSTLWWAKHAAEVVALEGDPGWYEELKGKVSPNVSLYLVDIALRDAEPILENRLFDVVVIDGLQRETCGHIAPSLLREGGALIIDNAEGYGEADGHTSITEQYRSQGFSRVDFYGHAPGVILPHCTSVLFKGRCFLWESADYPVHQLGASGNS